MNPKKNDVVLEGDVNAILEEARFMFLFVFLDTGSFEVGCSQCCVCVPPFLQMLGQESVFKWRPATVVSIFILFLSSECVCIEALPRLDVRVCVRLCV